MRTCFNAKAAKWGETQRSQRFLRWFVRVRPPRVSRVFRQDLQDYQDYEEVFPNPVNLVNPVRKERHSILPRLAFRKHSPKSKLRAERRRPTVPKDNARQFLTQRAQRGNAKVAKALARRYAIGTKMNWSSGLRSIFVSSTRGSASFVSAATRRLSCRRRGKTRRVGGGGARRPGVSPKPAAYRPPTIAR